MKKAEQDEMWDAICADVTKKVEQTYLNTPLAKRNQLGVEPDNTGKFADPDSYDRNRWMVCYISLLEWQRKARMLFNQQHTFLEEDST